MDNQLDHRRTLTPGHESHGVHVCNKCGWHYPNPHPSAKHRRAHKKICGTIEGYKLDGQQTHLNGSDDEHVSDDDKKTPGLVVSGPNNLETGQSDKGNFGIGAKLVSLRSEDEVFSDAVADFADSGLSSGIKEPLQQGSSGSGTSVEIVQIKDPEFSGSSEKSDFIDAADASQLIVEPSDDCQIQNPKTLQTERIEVGNTPELQGQLSSSSVDPLPSSIAGLRTEESSVVHSDDFFSLSGDSHRKTEVSPDVFSEKDYAGENVTDYNLISAAKVTNLMAKDEVKSAIDVVETVDSSDNVVGETCEGVSDTAVSSAISLDHQVVDEAVNLIEKNDTGFLSVLDQDDLALELNSVKITNALTDDQEESASEIQFATSSQVNISLEEAEGSVNVDFTPTHDERPDVAHPQSDYEDFKDPEGVVSQDPLILHSSELSKHDDDLKNSVTEENSFVFYPSQLTKKSDILSPDVHVVSSTSSTEKELENFEPMAEETHAEGNTEVSPVKLIVESFDGSHESGGSMSAMETEVKESHIVHLSEEHGTVEVSNDSDRISLLEGSLMTSLNENPRDASFGSATRETTGVISTDNTRHHEKNSIEINDVAVDGNVVRANVENGIGAETKDLQPGDLQLEAKQSSDLFKSDDADEMGKIEKYDITESPVISEAIVDDGTRKAKGIDTNIGPISAAQEYIKEDEINSSIKLHEDRSVDPSAASYHVQDAEWLIQAAENLSGKHASPLNTEPSALHAVKDNQDGDAGNEVSGIATMPVQDNKENEVVTDIKEHEGYSRSFDPSADSHDAELLVKSAENLSGKHTSLSSLNTESSVHRDYAVEDNQDGEAGGNASGITAVPVQDTSVNNLVKHNSSGIDVSVDSGSRCDSLEGNWGSVSVISLQSDAPAETLASTGSLASTEAGKSNMNNPKDVFHRQQFGKSEMFEPPSFMTWVEPGHVVSPKAADSEGQKGLDPQQPNSTMQAGWFPTLTQVTNESPGRKKNEEIIAKVTNWSTSKEHTPLKSLLGEAAQSNKPRSPRLEGNSANQKNSKIPENSISGLKTVNSILGPESPAAQAEKGEAAKEWNSPARYPADIKRDKGKVKSRPFWIQFVCCSSVDHQRR
ncbi:hypothetical protein RIF29_41911 [Crotalaria pallida]|uniref:C2H2-type domain-containing protein n=1 Tax=Crotalaria pallida TaxID=3830 RepID=A0AAN9HPU5_CROPI